MWLKRKHGPVQMTYLQLPNKKLFQTKQTKKGDPVRDRDEEGYIGNGDEGRGTAFQGHKNTKQTML
jgi:hypothetical protein